VELWFRDLDDGWGRNRRYYGGLEDNGKWYGAWWQDLMTNTIRVCRGRDDDAADRVRIRVFVPRGEAEYFYQSDWENMDVHTPTFTHGLGITETELAVSLWFRGPGRGIHHFGYGGLAVDRPITKMLGAHWYGLTTNTIQVRRHPHDADVEQARVTVIRPAPPHYDSLEDLGWQPIARDTPFTFSHDLDWNPDRLLVRAECSSTVGIHQWLAGGSVKGWGEPPRTGSKGANIQNLTTNTVQVFRWQHDDICPLVRVRAWRRLNRIYLPLVVRDS
jgi:hypothetical protein